jgi:nucleoid DNA-binding protein
LNHKVAERPQAKTMQVFDEQAAIIEARNALEFHTAKALAEPLVKAVELSFNIRKGGSKIAGKTGNNAVDLLNGELVKVMGADGKRADVILKFLQRHRSNRNMSGRKAKTKELETLKEGRELGFSGGKMKGEL